MYTVRDGKDHFILIDFDRAVKVDDQGQPLSATSPHHTGTFPFMAYELIEDMHAAEVEKTEGVTGTSRVVHCLRLDFQSVALVSLWCAIMLLPKADSDPKINTNAQKKATVKPRAGSSTGSTLDSQTVQTFGRQNAETIRYNDYLRAWEVGSYDAIASHKARMIENLGLKVAFSPLFRHLSTWFAAFLTPFAQGISRQREFELKQQWSYSSAESERVIPEQPSFNEYETQWGEVTLEAFQKSFKKYEEQRAKYLSACAK